MGSLCAYRFEGKWEGYLMAGKGGREMEAYGEGFVGPWPFAGMDIPRE